MQSLHDRQWWVIWAAVAVALSIWWSGLSESASTRARQSPTYVREVAVAARDYERYGDGAALNVLEAIAFDRAFAEARRQESTARALVTVVAVAGFLVWRLGNRT